MKSISAVLVALFLIFSRDTYASDEMAIELESLMASLHEQGKFNGALFVGKGGKIVYEGAWGTANSDLKFAITPETPVDGASLAKTFAAASVWILVAENKIDIESPVVNYLPYYPHPDKGRDPHSCYRGLKKSAFREYFKRSFYSTIMRRRLRPPVPARPK